MLGKTFLCLSKNGNDKNHLGSGCSACLQTCLFCCWVLRLLMAAPAIVMLRAAALVRTNGSDVRVRPTPQLRTTIVLGLSCPLTPCPCDPLHPLGQRIPCASSLSLLLGALAPGYLRDRE